MITRVNPENFDKVLDFLKKEASLWDGETRLATEKAVRCGDAKDLQVAKIVLAKHDAAHQLEQKLFTILCNYWPTEASNE
jgi:hypothetical protein